MARIIQLNTDGGPPAGEPWPDVLRVSTIYDPPYLTFENNNETGELEFSGFLVDLWAVVMAQLNMNYTLVPLLNRAYGTQEENGTWNGVVGEVAYDRADVGLLCMSMSVARGTVIDYLSMVPVMLSRYEFLLQSGDQVMPGLTSQLFQSLLRPLASDVWVLLLVLILLISVCLWVTVHLNHARAEPRQTVSQFSGSGCLLAAFTSMVGQGWDVTPSSLAGRIVTISSWMLGILVCTSYTANLMAFLTTETSQAPISSLAQFHAQPDWTIAVESGIVMLEEWKTGADLDLRRLQRRISRGDRVHVLDGSSESVRTAIRPRTLVFFDMSKTFSAVGNAGCSLLPLQRGPRAQKLGQFLVISKKYPALRDAINKILLRLRQSGNMERMRRNWFSNTDNICDSSVGSISALTLADLLAVLLLVPAACVAALVMLAAEVLTARLGGAGRRPEGKRRPSERPEASPDGVVKPAPHVALVRIGT